MRGSLRLRNHCGNQPDVSRSRRPSCRTIQKGHSCQGLAAAHDWRPANALVLVLKSFLVGRRLPGRKNAETVIRKELVKYLSKIKHGSIPLFFTTGQGREGHSGPYRKCSADNNLTKADSDTILLRNANEIVVVDNTPLGCLPG